jgi:hypothetical protein
MNDSVPHELYRTPRLRQAGGTLPASGREHGGQRQAVSEISFTIFSKLERFGSKIYNIWLKKVRFCKKYTIFVSRKNDKRKWKRKN